MRFTAKSFKLHYLSSTHTNVFIIQFAANKACAGSGKINSRLFLSVQLKLNASLFPITAFKNLGW